MTVLQAQDDISEERELVPDDPIGPRPVLLSGKALRLALGFGSGEGFRVAVREGRVPVPLFKLPGRQGWFCLEADVLAWLRQVASGRRCATCKPGEDA